MGTFIVILIIAGVVWLGMKTRQQRALNKAARDAFMTKHAGWDVYFAPLDHGVVAINHDNRAIVLGTVAAHKSYPWSAIASVDVLRDGTSVTSTNRGSQLVGAAAGELLLGPLGLLIGGVTGSKRTVQRVSQIAIKIIVDDRATPIYVLDFLRVPGTGADPKNELVKAAARRAEHVHALLFNAMRSAAVHQQSGRAQLPGPSKSDQIARLWQLKEAGALTESEFLEQKALLLRV